MALGRCRGVGAGLRVPGPRVDRAGALVHPRAREAGAGLQGVPALLLPEDLGPRRGRAGRFPRVRQVGAGLSDALSPLALELPGGLYLAGVYGARQRVRLGGLAPGLGERDRTGRRLGGLLGGLLHNEPGARDRHDPFPRATGAPLCGALRDQWVPPVLDRRVGARRQGGERHVPGASPDPAVPAAARDEQGNVPAGGEVPSRGILVPPSEGRLRADDVEGPAGGLVLEGARGALV
mmetsp:Transcript_31312/g.82179  ORF Transcript_31312/g.82179 Transcript_31312/m.82179 type:complete len:236 (-) Transcript_31312:59-766(-)